MLRVKVSQRDASGKVVPRGQLEYHGLKLRQPDGTVHIEKDEQGRRIPEEVILRPPGMVPPGVAVRIGQAVADGQRSGQTDGYDWSVVT
jgi:hypothetical protein